MTKHHHTLIRASAGTGKTFQLSNRYLGLLQTGVMPDQILATTFTRKAAGEILDRVITRLADAARAAELRAELGTHLGTGRLSRARCIGMLRTLTQNLHRLQICTLDSFFAQLAGSFCLELGLPPGWRIIEYVTDETLRSEAIELALRVDPDHDVVRLIHLMAKGEAQRSVSTLLRETVSNLYGLFLETDRQAWTRVPRPARLSRDELTEALDGLAHAPLLKDKRFANGHTANVAAAEAGDWETFIGQGLAAKILAGETTFARKEIPAETIGAYQRVLQHARAVLLEQLATQTEATYELLLKFHTHYQRLKHQAGVLRFEDVTRSLVGQTALEDVSRQHFRLDTRLHHLLLDEFQDTSLMQWQVLQPLAEHVIRPENTGASFFCVGDGKQAIYGWRGGRSEILDALHDQFPELTEQVLDTSYRSAQPIIDVVNATFSQAGQHPDLDNQGPAVRQWCDRFTPHATARSELAGYVELCTAPAAEKGGPDRQSDLTLAAAVDRIEQLIHQVPGAGVGVLVRKNDTVAQLIYELRSRGIPASEEGGHPLTDSSGVQVVLSLLKLVDHPGDSVACFHIAHSPLGSLIGLTDHRDRRQVLAVTSRLRHALLADGYGPTLLELARQLAPSCDRRDNSRLQQLVELAFDYRALESLRTTHFLAHVESTGMADPTSAEVRVMTVHQAKGLQFDIVVLPELDTALFGQTPACVVGQTSPTAPIDRVCVYRNQSIQQLLPQPLRSLFDEAILHSVQEALCVLYVSMTRAIHALHMIIAPSSPSEKHLPKTSGGLLRAALVGTGRVPPASTLYTTGDANWYVHPSAPQPAATTGGAEPVAPPATVAEPLTLCLAPPDLDAPGTRQSPSQLEGGGRVRAARLLDLQGRTATARGTLFHAWFEQIQWLDREQPDEPTLLRIAQQLDCANLDVPKQLATFGELLQKADVATALSHAAYQDVNGLMLGAIRFATPPTALRAEVHNEHRFAVRLDGQLMTGSIDRLVLLLDGNTPVAADIIDYKTDSLSADLAQLDELMVHYRPQIDAYRAAVAHLFQLAMEQVTGRLLFLSAGILRVVGGGDGAH